MKKERKPFLMKKKKKETNNPFRPKKYPQSFSELRSNSAEWCDCWAS